MLFWEKAIWCPTLRQTMGQAIRLMESSLHYTALVRVACINVRADDVLATFGVFSGKFSVHQQLILWLSTETAQCKTRSYSCDWYLKRHLRSYLLYDIYCPAPMRSFRPWSMRNCVTFKGVVAIKRLKVGVGVMERIRLFVVILNDQCGN